MVAPPMVKRETRDVDPLPLCGLRATNLFVGNFLVDFEDCKDYTQR